MVQVRLSPVLLVMRLIMNCRYSGRSAREKQVRPGLQSVIRDSPIAPACPGLRPYGATANLGRWDSSVSVKRSRSGNSSGSTSRRPGLPYRPDVLARRSTSARIASTVRSEFPAADFLIRNDFRIAGARRCSSSCSCWRPRSPASSRGRAEREAAGEACASPAIDAASARERTRTFMPLEGGGF